MSDVEEDEYFDALATGATLKKAKETNGGALNVVNGDNWNDIPITGGIGQNGDNLTAGNGSTLNAGQLTDTSSDKPAVDEAVVSMGRIATTICKDTPVTDNVAPDYYHVMPVTDTVTPDYYNVAQTSTHIVVTPSVEQRNTMSITENTNQVADDATKDTGKLLKGQGNVSQLASQFMERIAKNQSPYNSDQEDATTTKHHSKLIDLQHSGMKEVHKKAFTRTDLEAARNQEACTNLGNHTKAFSHAGLEKCNTAFSHTELEEHVAPHDASEPSVYSFAAPFPEDVTDNGSCGKIDTIEVPSKITDQCNNDGSEKQHVYSLVDSTGRLPNMFAVTEGTPNNSNESNLAAEQTDRKADVIVEQHNCSLNPSAVSVNRDQHIIAVDENSEHLVTQHSDEENIYDSVHNTLTRSGQASCGFVVVSHDEVGISHPVPASHTTKTKLTRGRGKTTERKQKVLAEHVTTELKRQQAKIKSKTLKRSTKSGLKDIY